MKIIWIYVIPILVLQWQVTIAQKIDDERMRRDIEVAENVLSTLIKQELNSQRTYFGLEIKGTYQEGYGITFRLPSDHSMPMIISGTIIGDGFGREILYNGNPAPTVAYSRTHTPSDEVPTTEKETTASSLKEVTKEKRKLKADSLRDEYNKKVVKAAKDFILDYGDFITQLRPDERIIVTNQGENKSWYFKENKRTHISIEGNKTDIIAFKQGKMNREQALAKLKVINTESVEVKEPDLELLSSIFNRLYRPDLSKTYFSENNLYYERLKDYGVIYYMQVYSSSGGGEGQMKRFHLPTQNMEDVDWETRNKKVKELYPLFEQELKENILEYGRTLKTLKDEEVLVFNVTLTKCEGCGIPSTLELTTKGSVLKDFGAGKIDKAAGLSTFTVKKGINQ